MSQVEANERVVSEAGVQVNGCAVSELDVQAAQRMIDFVSECPSMFHTVAALRQRLDAAGFTFVPEGQRWSIERGGAYYTVRNNSSLIAFRVGEKLDSYHFQLTAAHSDSPTYKVKAAPELVGPAEYLRLNVEAYGGVMDHTWFDKPLSVAGRVLVREGNRLVSVCPFTWTTRRMRASRRIEPSICARCSRPGRLNGVRSTRWLPKTLALPQATWWRAICSW